MDIVQLNSAGNAVTTTRVIAAGVGRDHESVMRLVLDNLLDLQEFGNPDFKSEKSGGRPKGYAVLNERQVTLLLTYMRNNAVVKEFKKRLVKAFFELSKQKRPEMTRMEALQMAMRAEQERLALLPMAEFGKQVACSEGAISIGEAAKVLGTGRTRLFAFLRDIEWVGKRNEPYQERINAGHMDVKISRWRHPYRGSLQESVTPLLTGKGMSRLQKIMRGM